MEFEQTDDQASSRTGVTVVMRQSKPNNTATGNFYRSQMLRRNSSYAVKENENVAHMSCLMIVFEVPS